MKPVRSMNGGPELSIILPVFNQALTLDRAIESVVQQTFSNWELIIINDGSTDDTQARAEAWATQHAQITVISTSNQGLSAALNCGSQKAMAAWLTFLNGDDYYLPEHLQANWDYLQTHSSVDLLMSFATVLGDRQVPDVLQPDKLVDIDECVLGGTFFVKKAIFAALGGHSEEYQFGTDYYFAEQAKTKGYEVVKWSGRTYVYDRTGADSITHTEAQKRGQALDFPPISG